MNNLFFKYIKKEYGLLLSKSIFSLNNVVLTFCKKFSYLTINNTVIKCVSLTWFFLFIIQVYIIIIKLLN